MSLRLFIYISILVHLVGAAGFYIYYNPLEKPLKVSQIKEQEILENLQNKYPVKPDQKIQKQKTKKFLKKPKLKIDKSFKIEPPTNVKSAQVKKNQAKIEDLPVAKDSTQHEGSKNPVLSQGNKIPAKVVPADAKPAQISNLQKTPEDPKIQNIDYEQVLEEPDSKNKTATGLENQKDPSIKDSIKDSQQEPNKDSAQKGASIDYEQVPQESDVSAGDDTDKNMKEINETSPQDSKGAEEIEAEGANSQQEIKFRTLFELKQKRGNPDLNYPEIAQRNKIEGSLIVIFYVTKDGLVEKIQLKKSSGHFELDNHVLRTLSRYEFLANQATWVRHEVKFKIEGKKEEPDLRILEIRENI